LGEDKNPTWQAVQYPLEREAAERDFNRSWSIRFRFGIL
jgi:hypothetical protein